MPPVGANDGSPLSVLEAIRDLLAQALGVELDQLKQLESERARADFDRDSEEIRSRTDGAEGGRKPYQTPDIDGRESQRRHITRAALQALDDRESSTAGPGSTAGLPDAGTGRLDATVRLLSSLGDSSLEQSVRQFRSFLAALSDFAGAWGFGSRQTTVDTAPQEVYNPSIEQPTLPGDGGWRRNETGEEKRPGLASIPASSMLPPTPPQPNLPPLPAELQPEKPAPTPAEVFGELPELPAPLQSGEVPTLPTIEPLEFEVPTFERPAAIPVPNAPTVTPLPEATPAATPTPTVATPTATPTPIPATDGLDFDLARQVARLFGSTPVPATVPTTPVPALPAIGQTVQADQPADLQDLVAAIRKLTEAVGRMDDNNRDETERGENVPASRPMERQRDALEAPPEYGSLLDALPKKPMASGAEEKGDGGRGIVGAIVRWVPLLGNLF